MIPASQVLTDDLQGTVGHMTAEVHDDLPWKGDLAVSSVSYDIRRGQIKVIGHDISDQFRCDHPFFIR